MPRPRPAPIAGIVALLLALGLLAAGVIEPVELASLDLRYRIRGTIEPGSQIVIVPISKQMLDPGILPFPLPRAFYTHALENLRRAGALAVGIDVLMDEQTADDPALAAEIRRWQGRVVLAIHHAAEAGITLRGPGSVNLRSPAGDSARNHFVLPGLGNLPAARGQVDLIPFWPRGAGYVEVRQLQDGVVHTIVPREHIAGTNIDSLSLALARLADPALASSVGAGVPLTIDYAGPAGTFRSLLDLGQVASPLFAYDKQDLRGKIVLIGATDPTLKDMFTSPFNVGAATTPGVEIHANAIWTILQKRPIRRSAPLDALATIVVGAFTLVAGTRLRPWLAAAATTSVIAIYAVVCQALFGRQLWLALTAPIVAALLIYVATETARLVVSLRELHRVEGIFGRFVSPTVMRQLLGKGDALRLGGERRRITVLFSDIRGFTALSEQLAPETVGAMLNEYFSLMVDIIFAEEGTVDKFVGDAIMAVFGAPLDQPDHAARAVRVALAMHEAATGLAARWEGEGRPGLHIGIGLHTGNAVVGNFGAERRSEYTAIGDAVNVASRLEGLCKEIKRQVIVSADTAADAGISNDARFEPLGEAPIRGRAGTIEIVGLRTEPAVTLPRTIR